MTSHGGRERTRRPATALRIAAALAVLAGLRASPVAAADSLPESLPLRIVADGIPEPLVGTAGDAARGRSLLVARASANCVLCHAVPDAQMRFAGNVGPSLAGVGTRFGSAQLRLRIADNLRVNPESVMPSYYRVDGLDRVAAQYTGKPILTAAEVEDVVAYLATLR
jgi:sulfur-oxidizing protein SoxX